MAEEHPYLVRTAHFAERLEQSEFSSSHAVSPSPCSWSPPSSCTAFRGSLRRGLTSSALLLRCSHVCNGFLKYAQRTISAIWGV
jgi:hypothetical protein